MRDEMLERLPQRPTDPLPEDVSRCGVRVVPTSLGTTREVIL